MPARSNGSSIAADLGTRSGRAQKRKISWRGVVMFAVAAILLSAAGSNAQVTSPVTLQGPSVTDDTTLYSNATSDNAGGGDTNRAGRTNTAGNRRLLIRFDVSSIPTNATITNVTLNLTCTNVPSAAAANSQALHRVTNSWVEGTGIGGGSAGQVVAGAATWDSRQHLSVLWTLAGGDFSATVSSTLNVGTSLGSKSWTGSGLVSDVQAWVNGSQPNNGWILIGDEAVAETARGYASAENLTTSSQPALVVSFTVPSSVEQWWIFE